MKCFFKKACLFGLFVMLFFATETRSTETTMDIKNIQNEKIIALKMNDSEKKLSFFVSDLHVTFTTQNKIHVRIPKNYMIYHQKSHMEKLSNMEDTKEDKYFEIIFPKDAKQPTTEEAVKYSCANADNKMTDDDRLNSPITDWYMKMFGVIPIEDNGTKYVTAGFDAGNQAKAIISFDTIMTDQQKLTFAKAFRKIASTSVGRVLLHRILIEIRRQKKFHAGYKGCDKDGKNNLLRNKNRSIMIGTTNTSGFMGVLTTVGNQGAIYVEDNETDVTVIGQHNSDDRYYHIVPSLNRYDTVLFHEMIHWFHCLIDHQRYKNELSAAGYCKGPDGQHLNQHFFGKYYWKDFFTDYKYDDAAFSPIRIPFVAPFKLGSDAKQMSVSEKNWRVERVVEEMRTILGVPNNNLGTPTNSPPYIEGDDISENLYRFCVKQPLRFGYDSKPYYEDDRVIEQVKNCVYQNAVAYGFAGLIITHNADTIYDVPYDSITEIGLGRCKRK